MHLHMIRARALGDELARHAVSVRDQAIYFAVSFAVWLVPGYLLISPPPNFSAWSIPFGLWFYEAFALGMIYVFGVLYCLAKCHVDPKRNFLIDFSCLYAPISVTTLIGGWAIFHVYASLVPLMLPYQSFDSHPYMLEFLYSARFFDLMRFFTVVGCTFVVFVRVGRHIGRVSRLRGAGEIDADATPRQ